eukprot:gnl/Dysnectes_brevis/1041_a1161_4292.p1 GENE.gnl/Dysnectes_brevis/1041_a1161_4292~~gnl/Dysnectes_brevis/1041_a1161_4292.p1  ORF type:complete len:332 (-),score=66.79 gnl/Dysnectes_brevis/1041_a1161_4292:31-1026(-)
MSNPSYSSLPEIKLNRDNSVPIALKLLEALNELHKHCIFIHNISPAIIRLENYSVGKLDVVFDLKAADSIKTRDYKAYDISKHLSRGSPQPTAQQRDAFALAMILKNDIFPQAKELTHIDCIAKALMEASLHSQCPDLELFRTALDRGLDPNHVEIHPDQLHAVGSFTLIEKTTGELCFKLHADTPLGSKPPTEALLDQLTLKINGKDVPFEASATIRVPLTRSGPVKAVLSISGRAIAFVDALVPEPAPVVPVDTRTTIMLGDRVRMVSAYGPIPVGAVGIVRSVDAGSPSIGIEFDQAHEGAHDGHSHFSCAADHGYYVNLENVERIIV